MRANESQVFNQWFCKIDLIESIIEMYSHTPMQIVHDSSQTIITKYFDIKQRKTVNHCNVNFSDDATFPIPDCYKGQQSTQMKINNKSNQIDTILQGLIFDKLSKKLMKLFQTHSSANKRRQKYIFVVDRHRNQCNDTCA